MFLFKSFLPGRLSSAAVVVVDTRCSTLFDRMTARELTNLIVKVCFTGFTIAGHWLESCQRLLSHACDLLNVIKEFLDERLHDMLSDNMTSLTLIY